MQIGLLNQPNFPETAGTTVDRNASESSGSDGVTDAGGGQPVTLLPSSGTSPSASSAILALRSDGASGSSQTLANGLVYSGGGKPLPTQDADTASMAEQYRLAMQRAGGSTTNLTVDKNGVLSASSGTAPVNGSSSDNTSHDFVTFAVSTMRDLADEQDRLKNTPAQASGSTAASLVAKGLGDVQKLAARFKLFA